MDSCKGRLVIGWINRWKDVYSWIEKPHPIADIDHIDPHLMIFFPHLTYPT